MTNRFKRNCRINGHSRQRFATDTAMQGWPHSATRGAGVQRPSAHFIKCPPLSSLYPRHRNRRPLTSDHRPPKMPVSETLIRVDHVSRKFCRSLKHSLWYGVCDIAKELNPLGRKSEVRSQMSDVGTPQSKLSPPPAPRPLTSVFRPPISARRSSGPSTTFPSCSSAGSALD